MTTDQHGVAEKGVGLWYPPMEPEFPTHLTKPVREVPRRVAPQIPAPTTVRDWDRTLDELWESPTAPDEAGLRVGVTERRIGQYRTASHNNRSTSELSLDSTDSDPMASLVHSARQTTLKRRRRRRVCKLAALTATPLVLICGAVVAATGITAPPTSASPDAAQTVAVAAAPAQQSPPWCPEVNEGARVSGAGPGDTTSGPGQILWLEYQMYVQRNADAARQVLAPAAAAAPIEETRAAITAIPKGTEHCVHMVALAADRFAVKVEERVGTGTSLTWDLVVTTAVQPDGRSLIAAIMPGTGDR